MLACVQNRLSRTSSPPDVRHRSLSIPQEIFSPPQRAAHPHPSARATPVPGAGPTSPRRVPPRSPPSFPPHSRIPVRRTPCSRARQFPHGTVAVHHRLLIPVRRSSLCIQPSTRQNPPHYTMVCCGSHTAAGVVRRKREGRFSPRPKPTADGARRWSFNRARLYGGTSLPHSSARQNCIVAADNGPHRSRSTATHSASQRCQPRQLRPFGLLINSPKTPSK